MGKPTVHDIARTAGVSLATVDRVLNARPGVRDKTVARVRAAVEELGYVRDLTAANLARQRHYRFAVALPEGPGQFAAGLRGALDEARRALLVDRVAVDALSVPAHDPHALARALLALEGAGYDGLAVMAPEAPPVRDALVRLRASGMAVVALVSDMPAAARDFFVGIDNTAAGRTAGVLMGRFLGPAPAKVLLVTDTLTARGSIERRRGFDAVAAAEFPGLRGLPTLETYGDVGRMTKVLRAAFASAPDVRGVYAFGTGTRAMLDVLGSVPPPPGGRTVIAHELTPATRGGLVSGQLDAVITQNTGHLVRSALRVLRARCDGREIYQAQERIRIEIVLRENLPEGP